MCGDGERGDGGSRDPGAGREKDKEKGGNTAGVELEKIVLNPKLQISVVFSQFWIFSLFVDN